MIDWSSIVFVVLGFSTSMKVGVKSSTSYPRTKDLPGEILYNARLSDGTDPP